MNERRVYRGSVCLLLCQHLLGPGQRVPSPRPADVSCPRDLATSQPQNAHPLRRAGSWGGDSQEAWAEMLPAGVSPCRRGDSRSFVGTSGPPVHSPSAPPAAPPPPAQLPRALLPPGSPSPGFLPIPFLSPPPHNRLRRPAAPHPPPPPPGSRDSPGPGRLLILTCHVPDPTAEGGASRPREGRGRHFRADKGRRHVTVGRNRPRWLPGCNFRRMRSAHATCGPRTGACA